MADFGEAMQRLMTERGMSLRALARALHYDVSGLSKVARGLKRPSSQMAAAVDSELTADGSLMRLAARPRVLTPDNAQRVLQAADKPSRLDPVVIASLGTVLAAQRRTEDTIGAAPMIPVVKAQLGIVQDLVIGAQGPLRPALVDVAGQWAQFAGWLHTARQQYGEADRWFGRSLEWAAEAGDDDLTATVLSYKGHVAWLRGHAGPVIGLSQAARRFPGIYTGQLAYDVLQEARGHAILGDAYQVDRLVDQADELADRALRDLPGAPPWHYYRSPAFWDLERGRSLAALPARTKNAAELLTAGLDALPDEHQGADWVSAYRRDLARC